METFLESLPTLLTIVFGGVIFLLQKSVNAQKKLKEIQKAIAKISSEAITFIAYAEAEYKDYTGGEKLEEVVGQLHEMIPEPLKLIITRDMVREIVQSTFDEVQKYMIAKLDKTTAGSKIE